jgi:hypothetical protein
MDICPQQPSPGSTARRRPRVEIMTAIVDRLTLASQIIETGTTSYRLAHARRSRSTPG